MDKKGANSGSSTNRRIKLQTKLCIVFSALTIVTSALLTIALYMTTRERLQQYIRERLINIAGIAALQIDGDAHATLTTPSQESDAAYTRIKHVLLRIREVSYDIRYVYTWRFNDAGQLVFVVDAETDPSEISHLGDIYQGNSDPLFLQKIASLKGPSADDKFVSDKWGTTLSGYAPFYRSDGQREGILGIDISAADVMAYERKFLCVALTVFGAIIPLSLAMGWILGRKLAAPIAKLTRGSQRIAGGDLSFRISLQSNDEIGNLAEAFNHMVEDLQKTTTSIDNLNREISNRKKTEETMLVLNQNLNEAVRQLSQANRQLSDFANIAAHDLKAPLRAIGTLADWIAADYADKFDEQGREKIKLLIGRAERMSKLLDALTLYCNVNQITETSERLDLNELLTEIIAEINPPSNIEITVEHKLPILIRNKKIIMHLFSNLLSNAVKYMDKPQGLIRIASVEENDFWKFSISDNGVGIESRYFDKIFEIFQTLSPRDKCESIGMGLSIVKKIVEAYGGSIWVESEPRYGSIFFFTLPKQKNEAIEDTELETENTTFSS